MIGFKSPIPTSRKSSNAKYKLVKTTDLDLDVNFYSSVIAADENLTRSIIASMQPNIYSYIKHHDNSSFCTCHHIDETISEERLLTKHQVLPKLSNLGHIKEKDSSVYLIGNYHAGLAIEDCISYSKKIFTKYLKSINKIY